MKQYQVAIVGYGGMGSWHAGKIATLDCVQLKGIYDILPERGKAAQEKGIASYPSFEAVLQDPEIDLITIATPNDIHKSLAIAAFEAGKNVVCEKPVTLSSSDLEEMIEAANRCKVLFTVHQNRRWDEDYLVTKKIYDENTLGKVFCIESRVQGSRGIPGDWRNTKEQGGGMVLDWGVHLLDQILLINPTPVQTVFAKLTNVTNEAVDDGFKALITFADGMEAQVEVGTSNFAALPRWYILGENGTAVIENWDIEGRIVKVSDWEKRDAVPVVTAAGLTKTMAPRTEETIQHYPLPRIESDVRDFYRNIAAVLDGKAQSIVTHHQLLRVMKLMEAIFESHETGQVVHRTI